MGLVRPSTIALQTQRPTLKPELITRRVVDYPVGDSALRGWYHLDETTVPFADSSGRGNSVGTVSGLGPAAYAETGSEARGTGKSVRMQAGGAVGGPDLADLDPGLGSYTWIWRIKTSMTTRGIWYRKSDASGVGGILVDIGGPSAGQPGALRTLITSAPQVGSIGVTGSVTWWRPFNDGNWHDVAVVLDRTRHFAYFYVDGNLEGQASTSALSATDLNATSGVNFNFNNASQEFVGNLDEFEFYARPLSQDELIARYAARTT